MPLHAEDILNAELAHASRSSQSGLGELFLTNTQLHPHQWSSLEARREDIQPWRDLVPGKRYAAARTVPLSAAGPLGRRLAAARLDELAALEIYLLARDLPGLSPGRYHLARASTGEPRLEDLGFLAAPAGSHPWRAGEVTGCAAWVVICGVPLRHTRTEGDRGVRHLLLDAGRVVERLWRAAGSSRVTPVRDVYHRRLHDLLGLDGVEEQVLAVLAVDAAEEPA